MNTNCSFSNYINNKWLIHFFKLLMSIIVVLILIESTLISAQDFNCNRIETNNSRIQSDSLNDYGTLWAWDNRYEDEALFGQDNLNDTIVQIGNDHRWKMVSCGDSVAIGLKSDGTLWGWGSNYYGQLGNGTTNTNKIFKQIGFENDWKLVSVGQMHCLAIKKDGSIWAWGKNRYGCLGDSTIPLDFIQTSPIQIKKGKMNDIVYIEAASIISTALSKDGTLWVWGNNGVGQLGDGTTDDRLTPIQIGISGEWLAVSCGYRYTCAIKKDGTLWAWGENRFGQLGDGTRVNRKAPIQIGSENNWSSISGAEFSTNALKSDGTLWGWGAELEGGMGDTTVKIALNPIQIGKDNNWTNINHRSRTTTGIKKDGSLWGWGETSYPNGIRTQVSSRVPVKLINENDIIFTGSNTDYRHYDYPYHIYPNYVIYIRRHKPTMPDVSTQPIINIESNTAMCGGIVISDGGESDAVRGVCYSIKPMPTIEDSTTTNGNGAGEYQSPMTNLEPFATYFVRAYVTNSLGTAYGREEAFITKLETPKLVSPANEAYEVQLNAPLICEKVNNAVGYSVQLSKSNGFGDVVVDELTNDSIYYYDNYELETTYFWRVRAINGTDSSNWSLIWSFTTSKFYPQLLTAPANELINIPIDCEVSWKENIPNSKYHLQISKYQKFSNSTFDSVISEIKYNCKKLECLTTYFWRVKAVDIPELSAWSPIWKFTTLMDSVNLVSPINLSKNISIPVAMSWDEGIYQKDYRLQISESNDFSTTNTDTLVTKTANADVINLNYWQKYFWRVRNESGDTLGYWSQIWQFKTRMSDILLMYPVDNQTGLEQEINFKWYPVIGAEYYQLQISKNDNFTDVVYSKDSITTTEKFVPALEKDILYYWRVRVWNAESIGTAYWSEVWTFTTGGMGVNEESNAVQIIPNPAGDFITISLEPSNVGNADLRSTQDEIQILNALGEKVMSVEMKNFSSLQRINISALPKGMYFVKVGGETAKFVKM